MLHSGHLVSHRISENPLLGSYLQLVVRLILKSEEHSMVTILWQRGHFSATSIRSFGILDISKALPPHFGQGILVILLILQISSSNHGTYFESS